MKKRTLSKSVLTLALECHWRQQVLLQRLQIRWA